MFYKVYHLVLKVFAKANSILVNAFWIRPIFANIDPDARILEIGGGYRPRFTKKRYPNVYHFDHASSDELRRKFSADPNVAHLVSNIQQIDFVADGSPMEDLVPTDLRFDVIFSSHALEHQVDLITHFNSLEKLLKPDGRVIMVIPDYRCCFDALRYPSVVSDVIAVHRRGASVHQRKQIFEHVTRTINVNPGRRLRGYDFSIAGINGSIEEGVSAVARSEKPDAAYEDLHAWIFFPPSFELLMLELYMLGYTQLRVEQVSPSYGNQFCVVLKSDERHSTLAVGVMDELENERLRLTKKARLK